MKNRKVIVVLIVILAVILLALIGMMVMLGQREQQPNVPETQPETTAASVKENPEEIPVFPEVTDAEEDADPLPEGQKVNGDAHPEESLPAQTEGDGAEQTPATEPTQAPATPPEFDFTLPENMTPIG